MKISVVLPCFIYFTFGLHPSASTLAAPPIISSEGAKQHPLTKESIQDSICRIVIFSRGGKPQAICSGTLTAEKEVITEAHCFDDYDKKMKTEISCGYQGIDESLRVEINLSGDRKLIDTGPRFKETLQLDEVYVHSDYYPDSIDSTLDVARLRLKSSSKLTPMKSVTPENRKEFYAENGWLQDSIECWIAGYGFDENGRAGDFRSAPIDRRQFVHYGNVIRFSQEILPDGNFCPELFDRIADRNAPEYSKNMDEVLNVLAKGGYLSSSVSSGDSGGPLYCKHLQEKEWTLMGVTIGSAASRFAPTRLGEKPTYRYANVFYDLAKPFETKRLNFK